MLEIVTKLSRYHLKKSMVILTIKVAEDCLLTPVVLIYIHIKAGSIIWYCQLFAIAILAQAILRVYLD